LDTLSRLTIHSHTIIALSKTDNEKLTRKAYSSFITYRILYLLASLLYPLPISVENTQWFKLDLNQITGMFLLPNNTCSFILYVYNGITYDTVVTNAMNNSLKILITFQGQLFRHISLLEDFLNHAIKQKVSSISNIITFDEFKYI